MRLKIKIAAIAVCALISFADNAMGDVCKQLNDSLCASAGNTGSLEYCTSGHTSGCWQVIGITILNVYSCDECAGVRELQEIETGQCSNIKATRCVCKNGCEDGSWESAGKEGYERRKYCGSTCVETTQYRCASGYYGNPTSATSGCTKKTCCEAGKYPDENNNCITCPFLGGSLRPTTTGENCVGIERCHLPAGAYTDETGTFTTPKSCFYKK